MTESESEFLGEEQGGELELVTKGILQSIEGAKGDKGSYFNLVPREYQAAVQEMAKKNFPNFTKQFPDFQAFLEVMSYNWLVKKELFETLVKTKGFQAIERSRQNATTLNRSAIACLTQNGSYALVGPGAYDLSGPGAAAAYIRIPLRVKTHSDFKLDSGVHLRTIPTTGKRFNIGKVTTSRLIAAYAITSKGHQEDRVMLERLGTDITTQFIDIDHKTVY